MMKKNTRLSFLIVALIYLSSWHILPKKTFWTIDNGNKFLQAHSLAQKNNDFSLLYPGAHIDPKFAFNPFSFFAYQKSNKIYSIFPIPFAWLSSIGYKHLGFYGLYILPLIATLFLFLAIIRLSTLVGIAPNSTLMLVALGTPIWFYAMLFWEMNIAVALLIWSTVYAFEYLQQKKTKYICLSAFFICLSIYFRNELGLYWVILLALIFFYSPTKIKSSAFFLFTSLITFSPLFLLQWKITGSPFGHHYQANAQFYSLWQHLTTRPQAIFNLLISSNTSVQVSLCVMVPICLLLFSNPKVNKRLFNLLIPAILLIASLNTFVVLYHYFTTQTRMVWVLHTGSLFVTTPLLTIAFLRLKENPQTPLLKLLWGIIVLYTLFYIALVPLLTTKGIAWGCRNLLILYPLISILAIKNLSLWLNLNYFRLKVLFLSIPIVLSLSAQSYSIALIHKKKTLSQKIQQEISKTNEEVIITQVWFLAQEMMPLFIEKKFFLVRSPQHIQALIPRLINQGYTRCLFIRRAKANQRTPQGHLINDHQFHFYSLVIHRFNLHSQKD